MCRPRRSPKTEEERHALVAGINYDDPKSKEVDHLVSDLKALKAGEAVPFTLRVVDAKGASHEVEMNAKVRNLDGSDPHKHH